MARLQVIDVGVFKGFGRSRDQLCDHRANLDERIRPQNVRYHDHAIALISLHFLFGDGLDGLGGDAAVVLLHPHLAFAANLRANEIMHENSKNLTALQISQVAAFLSSQ